MVETVKEIFIVSERTGLAPIVDCCHKQLGPWVVPRIRMPSTERENILVTSFVISRGCETLSRTCIAVLKGRPANSMKVETMNQPPPTVNPTLDMQWLVTKAIQKLFS